MSISTQRIQAVVRTYNKQLRFSGINRRDHHPQHPCVKDNDALWKAERKQWRPKNRCTQ